MKKKKNKQINKQTETETDTFACSRTAYTRYCQSEKQSKWALKKSCVDSLWHKKSRDKRRCDPRKMNVWKIFDLILIRRMNACVWVSRSTERRLHFNPCTHFERIMVIAFSLFLSLGFFFLTGKLMNLGVQPAVFFPCLKHFQWFTGLFSLLNYSLNSNRNFN